ARTAIAGRTGGVEDHVADLTRKAARAAIEMAIEDETSADAGTEGQVDEMAKALAGAKAMLAEGGGGRVVLHEAREAERRSDRRRNREVAKPRGVGGHNDAARGAVDEARAGD